MREPSERCAARFSRRYDASIDDVWRALTDPDALTRWLAPPPGVTIVRTEPDRLLELDWSPPGEPPSVVRIELREEGDQTLLVLDHSRIDAAVGMRYIRDWGRAFERFDNELNPRRDR